MIAETPAAEPQTSNPRFVSIDVMRGIDMFWIIGAQGLIGG